MVDNLVAAVIVEVMIGLPSWLRGQKARKVRDLVVVASVAVAIDIAVKVTMMKMKTMTMTIISAKQNRCI